MKEIKEKEEEGHAIIEAKLDISLPIVQTKRKMRARKNSRRIDSKEERRAKDTTRRRDIVKVKLILVKNGTPVMRVQAPKMKEWQALPFRSHHQHHASSPIFTNLSDNEDDYAPTCLLANGAKVTLSNLSHDDDDDESMLRNKMIKEFGINGYNIIIKLMEKLEKRKMTLEAQEDLLILEKERNLELQRSIDDKDEEIENLTRKLLLVNSTMEEREVELSKATNSIVNLKGANELLQSNISCLNVRNQELEVKFDTFWKSISSTSESSLEWG
jgi:hypothetical protein